MVTTIVRFFLKLWIKVPFGYICRVQHEDDSHMILRKDYWVLVTHKGITNALPVNAIAHKLQNELAMRMKSIGYDVDVFFDKNAYPNVIPLSEIQLHNPTNRVEPTLVEDADIAAVNEKR